MCGTNPHIVTVHYTAHMVRPADELRASTSALTVAGPRLDLYCAKAPECPRQTLPAHPTHHWFSVYSRPRAGTLVACRPGLLLTKMHDNMRSPAHGQPSHGVALQSRPSAAPKTSRGTGHPLPLHMSAESWQALDIAPCKSAHAACGSSAGRA